MFLFQPTSFLEPKYSRWWDIHSGERWDGDTAPHTSGIVWKRHSQVEILQRYSPITWDCDYMLSTTKHCVIGQLVKSYPTGTAWWEESFKDTQGTKQPNRNRKGKKESFLGRSLAYQNVPSHAVEVSFDLDTILLLWLGYDLFI